MGTGQNLAFGKQRCGGGFNGPKTGQKISRLLLWARSSCLLATTTRESKGSGIRIRKGIRPFPSEDNEKVLVAIRKAIENKNKTANKASDAIGAEAAPQHQR